MKIENLKNKRIAIFGFGREGKALLEYLTRHGAQPIAVFDEGELKQEDISLLEKSGTKLVPGPFKEENCKDIEVAFRSPGLSLKSIRGMLPQNAKITSLTNLFFANRKGKIVAVTGTKGKSTTVGLVAQILKQNNLKHFVGGNIGNPPLGFLDETTDDSYSVLELSSFQTEDLQYPPDVAIILPISADHLDYHKNQGEHFNFHESQEDYLAAKARLVQHMKDDSLLVAYDSGNVREIVLPTRARKIYFQENNSTQVGCFPDGEKTKCVFEGREDGFDGIDKLSREKKVPIVNILAAVTFGFALDLKVDVNSLLSSFQKLPLRIEFVGEIGSIKYYNDSAATNPVSTIAAMKTMTENYSLICGGSSKGLSFRKLAQTASSDRQLVKVFLYGQTSDEIKAQLDAAGFSKPVIKRENLSQIIKEISVAPEGFKTVLFSPASASFDQFKNYVERGETFERLVKDIS
jgi:UDP-N-acetylmuramoylalanine--D-glutamate ligase